MENSNSSNANPGVNPQQPVNEDNNINGGNQPPIPQSSSSSSLIGSHSNNNNASSSSSAAAAVQPKNNVSEVSSSNPPQENSMSSVLQKYDLQDPSRMAQLEAELHRLRGMERQTQGLLQMKENFLKERKEESAKEAAKVVDDFKQVFEGDLEPIGGQHTENLIHAIYQDKAVLSFEPDTPEEDKQNINRTATMFSAIGKTMRSLRDEIKELRAENKQITSIYKNRVPSQQHHNIGQQNNINGGGGGGASTASSSSQSNTQLPGYTLTNFFRRPPIVRPTTTSSSSPSPSLPQGSVPPNQPSSSKGKEDVSIPVPQQQQQQQVASSLNGSMNGGQLRSNIPMDNGFLNLLTTNNVIKTQRRTMVSGTRLARVENK